MASVDIFNKLKYFNEKEFPKGVIHLMDPGILMALDELREKSGVSIYPSIDPEGWARKNGSKTSRHYAVGRLSDACDIFPKKDAYHVFTVAQSMKFGGIGIYFDTKKTYRQPGPMLHIDLRPVRVVWARDDRGMYIYPARSNSEHKRFDDAINKYLASLK